jgi:adenine deaminase
MPHAAIERREFLTGTAAAGAAVAAAAATAGHSGPAGAQSSVSAAPATLPADLILKNGQVITIDARSSIAQAVAIAGDKVLAVGPDAAMTAHTAPGTRVLDLKGSRRA